MDAIVNEIFISVLTNNEERFSKIIKSANKDWLSHNKYMEDCEDNSDKILNDKLIYTLEYAIKNKNIFMCRTLLDLRVEQDEDTDNALLRINSVEIFKLFLEKSNRFKNKEFLTRVCRKKRETYLNTLLKTGMDQDILNFSLRQAQRTEHVGMVKLLLNYKAKPDYCELFYLYMLKNTPQNIEILRLLLQNGMDVNRIQKWDIYWRKTYYWTPLILICVKKRSFLRIFLEECDI